MVTTKTEVKVFTDIAVDPAAYNKPLTVVTGIFHVDHLMVVLMTLGFGTTLLKIRTFTFRFSLILFLQDNTYSSVTVQVVHCVNV